jgi:hypothetical protein
MATTLAGRAPQRWYVGVCCWVASRAMEEPTSVPLPAAADCSPTNPARPRHNHSIANSPFYFCKQYVLLLDHALPYF